MIDDVEPAPEPEIVRGLEDARDVRAEGDDLVRPPPHAVCVLVRPVAVEDGREQRGRHGPGEEDARQRPPALASRGEPQEPEPDEHRQVEQVVPARQRLHEPAGREQHQPAASGVLEISMEPRERERHPVRGQDLDVRELRHAVRREAEREAGDERAVMAPGDRVRQEVRRQRAQRKRQEERGVVAEQRIAAQPDHRRGDPGQPEQVLRKGHRPGGREELRRVPPLFGQRQDTRVPGHQPGVEQRVAEIVGNPAARVQDQRPRQGHGEDEVDGCREENRRAGHTPHEE